MTECNLQVPEAFTAGQEFSLQDRLAFWDAPDTIRYFQERGYTLYKRIYSCGGATCSSTPVIPSDDFVEESYPYASYDYISAPDRKLLAADTRAKVAFAQDSLGRHVAIKLVRDASDEYRILRFLSQQPVEILRSSCVIPVLELLAIDGFWFAIMPRWGGSATRPEPNAVIEVLDLMHAMLKGLSFLHEHNISHGDINDDNVLVSHFCDVREDTDCDIRRDLRSQRSLTYALFDFDFSVMLPPAADRAAYRLPYYRSWGSFCKVHDTAQGEFDYDPFVFDVGNMGVLFCTLYQHLTPAVPFLAPLLDRMTTRDLSRRFTAHEALQFFDGMLCHMSSSELKAPAWAEDFQGHVAYDEYDRWHNLPQDFVKRWAAYREPPVPRLTRFLRWLCRPEWANHVVARLRWLAFRLVSAPRTMYTHFIGLGLSLSSLLSQRHFYLQRTSK